MKNLFLLLAITALLVPVAALADGTTPSPAATAKAQCAQLKASMGTSFATTYGTNANRSNAFGQCVAKSTKTAATAVTNALQSCKAEQASDPAAFATKYGTNGKSGSKGAGQNALGKCVSAAVKQSTDTQTSAIVAAAKTCKSMLKTDAVAFAASYGKKANAFGKCVAAHTKTK